MPFPITINGNTYDAPDFLPPQPYDINLGKFLYDLSRVSLAQTYGRFGLPVTIAPGTGSRTLTVPTDLPVRPGMWLHMQGLLVNVPPGSTSSPVPTRVVTAQVISYSGTTLQINVANDFTLSSGSPIWWLCTQGAWAQPLASNTLSRAGVRPFPEDSLYLMEDCLQGHNLTTYFDVLSMGSISFSSSMSDPDHPGIAKVHAMAAFCMGWNRINLGATNDRSRVCFRVSGRGAGLLFAGWFGRGPGETGSPIATLSIPTGPATGPGLRASMSSVVTESPYYVSSGGGTPAVGILRFGDWITFEVVKAAFGWTYTLYNCTTHQTQTGTIADVPSGSSSVFSPSIGLYGVSSYASNPITLELDYMEVQAAR